MPAKVDLGTLAVLDAVRAVFWWFLVTFAVLLGLHYRRKGSRSTGWRLYGLISGCIACWAAYMTMWAVHNSVVRTAGYSATTDTLYRICIPLYEGSMASFMGLLLLLAAGYSITRNNLGAYKPQVIGLPSLLFFTGVVTDYATFQIFESTTNQLQLFEMAGWQQGLWFVFAFVNLSAYGFWVVYMFEIIQVEVDAIKAQEELNLVRNAAPSATVAPFPGSFSQGQGTASHQDQAAPPPSSHAAPPPGLDPHWAQAAAEEGVVAYKNLLGPGQNMSHVPGADVEAQEISTVADMVNFEVKRRMYSRFMAGFAVFMVAQLCVILSPVFVIDIVQEVITFLQFAIVWGFLATLLWLFRPAEDSPYLLMGEGLDALDTALGVEEDDGNELDGYSSSRGRANGGLEMTSAAPGSSAQGGGGSKWSSGVRGSGAMMNGSSAGGGGGSSNGNGTLDREAGRDQRGGGGGHVVLGGPPATLPAIKTSLGGGSTGGAAAAGATAAAAVGGQQQQQGQGAALAAAPSAHFSLGDEDELHEIQLDSARAPAQPSASGAAAAVVAAGGAAAAPSAQQSGGVL